MVFSSFLASSYDFIITYERVNFKVRRTQEREKNPNATKNKRENYLIRKNNIKRIKLKLEEEKKGKTHKRIRVHFTDSAGSIYAVEMI